MKLRVWKRTGPGEIEFYPDLIEWARTKPIWIAAPVLGGTMLGSCLALASILPLLLWALGVI